VAEGEWVMKLINSMTYVYITYQFLYDEAVWRTWYKLKL
jgi:hypothetical protein